MGKNDHLSETLPMTGAAFDATHARSYAAGPPRQVPGFAGLHRMTSILLAERVPSRGNVLIVGAGGGLELRALASDHDGWTFDGIDPSADMLRLAEQISAPYANRIRLYEGYIESAPDGPFDGAVCLLTLHFVPRDQRPETLRQIRLRLKPGAPFIAAHMSFGQTEPERSMWISRHLAFADTDPAKRDNAMQAITSKLSILPPDEDEAMLRKAGFSGVSLFYAGLGFRGWVGYA